MRENMGLYRGKRLDNGKWVQGSLLKVTLNGKTVYLIFGDDFSLVGNDVKALSHALVDPATVGQYTDLEDKNGERIFEGDIVRYGKKTGVVNWGIGCFSVKTFVPVGYYNNPAIDIVLNEYPNDIEVIGNIHDNPELLEVMK